MNTTTLTQTATGPLHPRTLIGVNGLVAGMKIEVVEDGQVVASGTLMRVDIDREKGGRQRIEFFDDSDERTEKFLFFEDIQAWRMLFPGLFGELRFDLRGKTYTIRGQPVNSFY